MTHAIVHGDVLATLRALPSNSFDGCLTDPPYGFRFMNKAWDYDVPSVDVWREVLRVLKPGAALLSFGGSKTYHRLVCGIEDGGFELRDCLARWHAKGRPASTNKALIPVEGYNTCLKPAWEGICFARKPVDGAVTDNFKTHGTGLLDIDSCRVSGRWPANLILDECAGNLLDSCNPITRSVPYPEHTAKGAVLPLTVRSAGGYADEGGPSRFFFSAKVSTKEREAGCETLPMRSAGECTTDRKDGSAGLSNMRAGAGRTGGAHNHHPTLKPIALNRWLASLIKPPTAYAGSKLLVPYAGAGSEMIGALLSGWPLVLGIEGEAEYLPIAHARIQHWVK